MKILGIIPARGGSKGIPNKNITSLSGKPLIYHTIKSALESKFLDELILSTDDHRIADVAKEYGAKVPFIRPSRLAKDDSDSIDVALHAVAWMKEKKSYHPDAIFLLQPTSPLRRSEHMDQAIRIFIEKDADTVVSIVEVPHNYSPYNLMQLGGNGTVDNYLKGPVNFNRYRRQDIPVMYARNGPAILITKTDIILNKKSFYGNKNYPYIMSQADSVDIDSLLDLQLASLLIKKDL